MLARERSQSHRLRAGRWSETGRTYLVTTVTRERKPVFDCWIAGFACARTLHAAPADSSIDTLAWVLMPDHVHWLITLQETRLEDVVRRFKSRAARAVNTSTGRTGPLWQGGYHDRAVRREEDLQNLARYVIANPVRAGLCQRVLDYPLWDAAWL